MFSGITVYMGKYWDKSLRRYMSMKNKILSVIISGLLLSVTPVQFYTNAAEYGNANISAVNSEASVYSAGLISDYALSCSGGSKTVYINAEVYGTAKMAKIGFKNIKVQRSSDKNSWITEKTPPDQISEDAAQKLLSRYSVSVKGGYYYRVVLDNYAKEDAFWFPDEQTVTATSNSVWIP